MPGCLDPFDPTTNPSPYDLLAIAENCLRGGWVGRAGSALHILGAKLRKQRHHPNYRALAQRWSDLSKVFNTVESYSRMIMRRPGLWSSSYDYNKRKDEILALCNKLLDELIQ